LVLPDINVTDSDGSTYTQPSVEDVVCTLSPDTSLEVNGTPEGTFAAGSTIEVNITDGVNPVTPDNVTVVGDVVTIEVPAAVSAVTRSTATLMKTGQTTSFRTGDDGDLEAGRDTDFLTLDAAPLHNDGSATLNTTTNRLTDILGGSTYADDIVLDWSTWNGSTLLGYDKNYLANGLWATAIDNCLAHTNGIFTTGWRLPNVREIINLNDYGSSQSFNYAPFNFNTTLNFWSSTTRPSATAFAFSLNTASGTLNVTGKGSASYTPLPVRTFSLSLLNVLS
jgi:hypothetical protein